MNSHISEFNKLCIPYYSIRVLNCKSEISEISEKNGQVYSGPINKTCRYGKNFYSLLSDLILLEVFYSA